MNNLVFLACFSAFMTYDCFGVGVYISYADDSREDIIGKKVCIVRHEGTNVLFHEHNDTATITRDGCRNAATLGHDLMQRVSDETEVYCDNTNRCKQTACALNASMQLAMKYGIDDEEIDLGIKREGLDFISQNPAVMHRILRDVKKLIPEKNNEWNFLTNLLGDIESQYGYGAANVVGTLFNIILGKDIMKHNARWDVTKDIQKQYVDEVVYLHNNVFASGSSRYIVVHHSVFMSLTMFYGAICNGRELVSTMSDIRDELKKNPMELTRYLSKLEYCLVHYRPKYLGSMCLSWGIGDSVNIEILNDKICKARDQFGDMIDSYRSSIFSNLLKIVCFAISNGILDTYDFFTTPDTVGHKECMLKFRDKNEIEKSPWSKRIFALGSAVLNCMRFCVASVRRCLSWSV